MMAALKAEFRKLLTVRSTYVIVAVSLALMAFFAAYIFGYRLKSAELANPHQLQDTMSGAVSVVAIFGAIVGILLLSHEYRYNTILYALTANRSRSLFLAAKILAVSTFAILFTVVVMVLAPLLNVLGVHLAGHTLAPQSIAYGNIVWQCLFYGWAYAMIGLLVTALVRNQIGAIVTIFIVPSTIEPLLSLLLKENGVYLPFSALGAVVQNSPTLGPGAAAAVVGAYLGVGWLLAWLLFLRRDAN